MPHISSKCTPIKTHTTVFTPMSNSGWLTAVDDDDDDDRQKEENWVREVIPFSLKNIIFF